MSNNMINSEMHTLYKKEISEKKILVDKEKKLYKIVPKHTRFRFFIGGFNERKRGLHAVIDELKNAGKHDELELIISSNGGNVLEGQQFFNIILEKFVGRTTAYLDNHGYSMGALLFSMCDKRVAYPYSDFMYHNYFGGSFGKGGDLVARVKHRDKVLKDFFKDIIVSQGFLTKDEYKQMILGKDFWMDTKELCKRGIATHVVLAGKEVTAKEYLKFLKKKKKLKASND